MEHQQRAAGQPGDIAGWAGSPVVKEAAAPQWGGYFGYFSDPDGYLWKVACSS
jgi:uncharacterized glyoxalase superfamily protein PhnB